MARIWQFQSSFNRGELDPRLVGRKDIQAYYAGARDAQNVVTLVHWSKVVFVVAMVLSL